MTAVVTAGAGFLLAVLWLDLIFDVQVVRHRDSRAALPESVLASISRYYRRATTEAQPMGALIAAVMLSTLVAIGVQIADGDSPALVGPIAFVLAGTAIAVAGLRTVPAAVRLGTRLDPPDVQSQLARSICRDHVLCFAAITSVLAIELAWG